MLVKLLLLSQVLFIEHIITFTASVYNAGSSSHDKAADDGNVEEEDVEEESEEDDGFLSTEQLKLRICCNPLSEEYLSWKENIIANAREQLQSIPS